jgi:hypothetical protein
MRKVGDQYAVWYAEQLLEEDPNEGVSLCRIHKSHRGRRQSETEPLFGTRCTTLGNNFNGLLAGKEPETW